MRPLTVCVPLSSWRDISLNDAFHRDRLIEKGSGAEVLDEMGG
ncbi:hypothetical protein WMF31_23535 [Sorangium sp. So ce1036]